jgi:hypothetical protein
MAAADDYVRCPDVCVQTVWQPSSSPFSWLRQVRSRVRALQAITGSWVIVPEASVWRDRQGRPVNIRIFGAGLMAEHDDHTLALATENEKGLVWRYNLDGSESHNVVPSPRGNEANTSTVTARGNKITITTRSVHEGASPMTIRTIELSADGTVRVEAAFWEGSAMIGSVYRRVENLRHLTGR